MKVSDFIINWFIDKGVTTAFGISGGAILHLCDSASHNPKMRMIYGAHEQHCVAMADGYGRIRNLPGLALVTSGPGATNCLTSICNAYYDFVPLVLITGQVASNRLMTEEDRKEGKRQRGFQETPVTEIFKPVTVAAVQAKGPKDIPILLETLWNDSIRHRGPVLLDICDDHQRAVIDV